jgi:hypothetical protein
MKKLLTVLPLLVLSVPAVAQEAGMFGSTFRVGGSTSVGVIYNPITNLAIRPSVSFSTSTSESTDDDGPEDFDQYKGDRSSIGGGLDVLYYLSTWNGLSAYIGAGGSHTSSKNISTTTYKSSWRDTTYTQTTKDKRASASGFFGLQYNVARWLALYGEIVGSYSWNTSKEEEDTSRTLKGTAFSLFNSGVGIIIYF